MYNINITQVFSYMFFPNLSVPSYKITLIAFTAANFEDRPTPCSPTPCGANAICKEQGGAGSCTCLPEYIGNPYEGCRPECVMNSDCSSNLACIRSKCQDPCPGSCAQNARCQVISHAPSCTCFEGYTGDPFRYCAFLDLFRKNLFPYRHNEYL